MCVELVSCGQQNVFKNFSIPHKLPLTPVERIECLGSYCLTVNSTQDMKSANYLCPFIHSMNSKPESVSENKITIKKLKLKNRNKNKKKCRIEQKIYSTSVTD